MLMLALCSVPGCHAALQTDRASAPDRAVAVIAPGYVVSIATFSVIQQAMSPSMMVRIPERCLEVFEYWLYGLAFHQTDDLRRLAMLANIDPPVAELGRSVTPTLSCLRRDVSISV